MVTFNFNHMFGGNHCGARNEGAFDSSRPQGSVSFWVPGSFDSVTAYLNAELESLDFFQLLEPLSDDMKNLSGHQSQHNNGPP